VAFHNVTVDECRVTRTGFTRYTYLPLERREILILPMLDRRTVVL